MPTRCRRSSSARNISAAVTSFTRSRTLASSIRCCKARSGRHERARGSTLKVGLVQMRSGLEPAANLTAARSSIEQAARAGADYVLTPEMTNIMEVKRERLFAALAKEERDPTLAALRE